MGTTGTGRFGDYGAGQDEGDRCDKAFAADLEDLATCAFYRDHESLPPAGTLIALIVNQRVTVVTAGTGEEIGHLPTEFNYLRACIRSGRIYEGLVKSIAERPLLRVSVDIAPTN